LIQAVDRLTAAGAQIAAVVNETTEPDSRPDDMVMIDPEGNEFCVV